MAVKYKEIARKLEQKIIAGEFDATNKLPTEDELMMVYQVSRNTIRNAIVTLVKLGLVIPVQGSGVFIGQKPQSGRMSLEGFQGLTCGFAEEKVDTHVVEFQQIGADREIAEKLRIELGSPVYYIERVRYLNDKPHVYEVSYFNKQVIPYLELNIVESSIYRYIREDLKYTIGYVYRIICADKLPSKFAEYLWLKEGDPTLVITNTAMLKNGIVFDYSIDYHHYQNASYIKLANFT